VHKNVDLCTIPINNFAIEPRIPRPSNFSTHEASPIKALQYLGVSGNKSFY
jgi:hypothetical protein